MIVSSRTRFSCFLLTLSVGIEKQVTRFRQISGDLIAPSIAPVAAGTVNMSAAQPIASGQVPGTHAAALGGRLDQLALWVKDVESESGVA